MARWGRAVGEEGRGGAGRHDEDDGARKTIGLRSSLKHDPSHINLLQSQNLAQWENVSVSVSKRPIINKFLKFFRQIKDAYK